MSGEPPGLFNSSLVHIRERARYSSSTEREVPPAIAESQRLCGFWSSREKLNRLGAGCRKRARWLGYWDERLRAGMRNNMFLAKGAIIAMKERCGWPIKKRDYSWAWRRLAEEGSWLLNLPAWVCLQQGNDLQGGGCPNSVSTPSRHWAVLRAEWSVEILHWLVTICMYRTWKEYSSETKVEKE